MTRSAPPRLDWTIVRRHPAADYRVFRIVQHDAVHPHSGATHTFTVMHAPDWVNVVALTEDRQIVLVRQYRHGTEQETLEIPGGMVEPDESALEAAQRELREETGYEADDWQVIGVVEPNPAIQANRCTTLLCTGARLGSAASPDPGEVIQVETQPLDAIAALVASGAITHALVVAAFYHLQRHLERA